MKKHDDPAFVAMSTKANRGNSTEEERAANRRRVELQETKPAPLSANYSQRRELFCNDCEHRHKRGCCDECRKAGQKINAMEECPDGKWTKYAQPAGIKVNAMLPGSVINSRAHGSLVKVCADHGLRLDSRNHAENYRSRLVQTNNVITWGMRLRHEQYGSGNRNVLFVENGLLKQSKGFFVDAGGFFSDSDFCKSKAWHQQPTAQEVQNLKSVVRGRFGWELFQGGNRRGPIIITLQQPGDAPLRYYYQLAEGHTDKNRRTLELVRESLKGRKRVIVRPHPRDTNFNRSKYEDLFKSNWSWDDSPNIYETLPKCSALITANSTTAIEALTLGIPVCTLGEHVWTGSGVCNGAANITKGFARVLSEDAVGKTPFLCAVLRHEIPYGASVQSVQQNQSVQTWIKRAMDRPMPTRRCVGGNPWDVALEETKAMEIPQATMNVSPLHPYAHELKNGTRKEITLGFVGMSHLGDVLSSTTLPRKIKETYGFDIKVYITRHRSTLQVFENNPYVDGFKNEDSQALGLKNLPNGIAHHIHKIEAYWGVPMDPVQRPEVYLTDMEKKWAVDLQKRMPKPIVVLSTRHVTDGASDLYAKWPWQKWCDHLEREYSVIQPVLSLEKYQKQASMAEKDSLAWQPETEYTENVMRDLTLRQYLSLFYVTSGHLGVKSGGVFAAQTFDVPAMIGCDQHFPERQRTVWVFKNQQLFHYEPSIEWNEDQSIGFFRVKDSDKPYDQAYFNRYVEYEKTATGKALTNVRKSLVMKYTSVESVVDVGVGSGMFARAIGCKGYDINPVAVSMLKKEKIWKNPYKRKVDSVSMWDVFEHIEDHAKLLEKVDNYVFMSLPIFLDPAHAKNSKHFRTDEHYWYFTRSGIINHMMSFGFGLIEHSTIESSIGREDIETFVFRRV